ncbi:hypothetical protein CHGG_07878 [Chaetomium globosum CBS 148.51]|uniref:Uncharacterized protein n=1 Tax=Chaetomium globosum (strain ATCC 6205 / CBS 148.51 / DSM 1962 / NBRC 6347 / NRRL 1970) TaxID=306901 RepID=Q2GVX6_CHAGB|nr:uncharacterized protein CHGG_07878 [Chaetomium globosum CBS 148.51]EAQ86625.1 hypothetical protein CHGG_07878 [Chaetomium globosum CBS 148.51]
MACLLDFAFRKLIGVRGTCPGMRTIKNLASPSLTEIAPAVWDLQYLQTMSVHAQVIPSIAAGIARLKNARSASLRDKVDNLTRQTTIGNDGQMLADSVNEVTDEIEKRLWLLCQTRIQPEPIKRPFTAKQGDENRAKKVRRQLEYVRPELEIPTTYVDEDGSGTFAAMEGYSLEPDCDPYVAFPGFFPEAAHLGIDAVLQADESYIPAEGVSPPDDWTHSSEGDYFYTDGQGNVYPIERENSEDDQIDWPPVPQLVDSDGYGQQQDEEWKGYWGQGANQAYIMPHEDGLPDFGVHIHPDDAANQPFLPPYSEDAPLGYWARD